MLRLLGGAPLVVGACSEYGGNTSGGLSSTREPRWASETEGELLKIVVEEILRGIMEGAREADGAGITFTPVRDAPDRFGPIFVEVLVAAWLVVECCDVAVGLVCGYL